MIPASKLERSKTIAIAEARSPVEIAQVRELFLEYAKSLGFSLCFQGFDKELAALPGKYAPPDGRLLLALANGQPAGCVGLHKLEEEICEMKRLYVKPEFRGIGIGETLTQEIIRKARELGYRRMRLDTVPSVMASAVRMYRALGFCEIAPYTHNPVEGAIFLELEL